MIQSPVKRLLHLTACLFLMTTFLPLGHALASTVVVYPKPKVRSISQDYGVEVAPVNSGVVGASTYVSAIHFKPTDFVQSSFAHFSFDGVVKVTVKALDNKPITKFTISPLHFNIAGTKSGNTVSFYLDTSRYVIVKTENADGDATKPIVIAADALETNVPSLTDRSVLDITRSPYYVTPDTGADSTAQIQAAINEAASMKGVAYVPAGVYNISRLTLPSNVTLYLAGGSVLRDNGVKNADADFFKSSLGLEGKWLISTVPGSSGITIRGRGMIDGNGYEMRQTYKYLSTLIMPISTKNFKVDGIIGWNSSFWALTPSLSEGVEIRNYKAINDLGGYPDCKINRDCFWENDAIDINESSDVYVKHVIALSKDDPYSTKTWCSQDTYNKKPGADSRGTMVKKWGSVTKPIQNVRFEDVVAWTSGRAFKIGNGICSNQTGVTFDGGYVFRANYAAEIAVGSAGNWSDWTSPKQVGSLDQIHFKNIDVEDVYGGWGHIEAAPTDNAPITRVYFKNFRIRPESHSKKIDVVKTSPSEIDTVTFENIVINGSAIKSVSEIPYTVFPNALTNVKLQ